MTESDSLETGKSDGTQSKTQNIELLRILTVHCLNRWQHTSYISVVILKDYSVMNEPGG